MNIRSYTVEETFTTDIKIPKLAWKCQLTECTFWYVEEGKQPNWFHRKMQHIILGFKWSKVK